MKFILGKKLEMTQVFKDNGDVVPVTAVLAEPNVITQLKTKGKENTTAVQVGFGAAKKLKKPQAGHLKDLPKLKTLREFEIAEDEMGGLNRGDVITVGAFEAGDKIKVTGNSKGRGFQGVVKRHGFHGQKSSHGHKDQERMPGSIGNTDPQRVMKGKRMPGHMGDAQVTVSGLKVVEIDKEKNILYVSGAVPGARNGLLMIYGPGKMELKKEEVKQEEASVEGIKKEVKIEDQTKASEEVKEKK